MSDPRFFARLGPKSVLSIAQEAGFTVSDAKLAAEILLDDVASLDAAQSNHCAFLETAPKAGTALASKAGAIVLRAAHADLLPAGTVGIFCNAPRGDFAKIVHALLSEHRHVGNQPIDSIAQLEAGVVCGPNVVIGAGAAIGQGTIIEAGAIIGAGVQIGRACRIGAGSVVEHSLIGDHVHIGPNCTIGTAGFGVAASSTGLVAVPQLGRVIIQDGCHIGAQVAIDRGAFDDTVLGFNCHIDNQCHIAHNVRLGQGVIMAAFGGIAGSAVIGDYVMMGGRVGIKDHVHVGDGAKLGACSAVLGDVPAGATFVGYPAVDQKQWLRELASVRRLAQGPKKRP